MGGCANGQLMVWDIGEYLPKLQREISIWDHDVVMDTQTDHLHVHDGFIPVLYWSAESSLEHSHKSGVEDIQWLPSDVWFTTESAYPKQNPKPNMRQLITCASDNFIYVWDLANEESREGLGSGGSGIRKQEVPLYKHNPHLPR